MDNLNAPDQDPSHGSFGFRQSDTPAISSQVSCQQICIILTEIQMATSNDINSVSGEHTWSSYQADLRNTGMRVLRDAGCACQPNRHTMFMPQRVTLAGRGAKGRAHILQKEVPP